MTRKIISDQTWLAIKTDYQMGMGVRALERKYDIAKSTIDSRCKKECWRQELKNIPVSSDEIKNTLKNCFDADLEKLQLIKEIYQLKKECDQPKIIKINPDKKGVQEKTALDTIEQLLNIKLIRQYYIDGFKIDGYDDINNVAYEIDEKHHNNARNGKHDMLRQKYIEQKLNCRFIRIKV